MMILSSACQLSHADHPGPCRSARPSAVSYTTPWDTIICAHVCHATLLPESVAWRCTCRLRMLAPPAPVPRVGLNRNHGEPPWKKFQAGRRMIRRRQPVRPCAYVAFSTATACRSTSHSSTSQQEHSSLMPLTLTSSAFSHYGNMPIRYTCEGEDISPPLTSPVMKSRFDQSVSGATMMMITSMAGLPSMFATMAIARAASN